MTGGSGYEYGQKEPMENEAMVRTLEAQIRAIWPQEREVLRPLFSRPGLEVIDVGCGTGQAASRVLREFAPKQVTGIDLAESHIAIARRLFSDPGLSFRQGDATNMPFADNMFDVAICRHMLQAIPDPSRVIREMIRVIRPGGSLYVLAEDYGMLFFHPTRFDTDEFFRRYAGRAAAKTGSDLRQGRKMPALLRMLKCGQVSAHYLPIDTLRVDRTLLAEVLTHWRDGFADWISRNSGMPQDDVRDRFNDMIDCTASENGYMLWLVPCISATVTEAAKSGPGK